MTTPEMSPRFLTLQEILLLQRLSIHEFGGPHGVRDQGLLESALQQPQAGTSAGWLHAYPFEMAAAYAYHLARNHPFVDGNKRIAWIAMRMFLWFAGYRLHAPDSVAIQLVLDLAQGTLRKPELATFLAENCRAK